MTVRGTVTIERRRLVAPLGWPLRHMPIEVVTTTNLVMTAGLRYYAQRAAGEGETNTFRAFVLFENDVGITPALADTYTDGGVPVGGTLKRMSSQFAKTDDQDPGNSVEAGPLVVTYAVTYGMAEANDVAINGVAITNYAAGAPSASEPLLMHARFPAVTKTDQEELTIRVNHVFGNVV